MRLVGQHIRASLLTRRALRDPGVWFILLTLAGTTTLHYLTDIQLIPYHSIYRSLYYVPIAIAAVRYGRRGGVITALTATVLYIPHVVLSWNVLMDDAFNDLLENAIFLFVGAFAGTLADAERRQRKRAQEAVLQFDRTNKELQVQVALAERMRASTESILESVDSGVITFNTEGRIVTVNRAAEVLLGDAEHHDNTLPVAIRDYLNGSARGYRQVSVAGRMLGIHGSPLIGALGEEIGTVLVLDDLTEQRALEEQVQRAQRLSALGRLAGGLAHEIRNPLGITRAAAQMLHRELGEHARYGEYTEVIQTEIDRIDRLVEQLLSYARPLPLQRGSVDVEAVIERTVALTRAYARQQQILLHCDIEDQLPFIEGDGELLHQALVNLLLNGITATGQGGNVSIAAKAAAGESSRQVVIITVSDTGRGIAPADLPHIFDPFFTTRADGTGLGLSIVQQIIEEHGGTIEVDSQPGCGARFLLRIPALAHDAHITSDVPHGQSS